MSFLAKLHIDDQEFNILEFSFDVTQPTNSVGQVISTPNLGSIDVLIESRSNTEFYAWSIGINTIKDGEIIFYKRDNSAKARTLEFKDSICVYFKETFNSNSNNPMKTRLKISARSVTLDDTEYEVSWGNDY